MIRSVLIKNVHKVSLSIGSRYTRSFVSMPDPSDIQHKTKELLKNRADESNKKRIKKVRSVVNTVVTYIDKSDSDRLDPVKDQTLNAYQKFKAFMKNYGYIGLTNYWLTYGTVYASAYMACKYGVIDYHSWEWLHLEQMENKVIESSKHWFNVDMSIDKRFEDAVAAFLISKITKPVQWVYIYFSTPWFAKVVKNSNFYKRFYS